MLSLKALYIKNHYNNSGKMKSNLQNGKLANFSKKK